jgi:ABC-2 type transport system ATP-binding protein
MNIISTKNISRNFSKTEFDWNNFKFKREDKIAVSNLSIDIEEGELVGFLGPNGAGKTTFLKILSGIMYPTSGTAKVLGYIPWDRDYRLLNQFSIVMGQKNQLWWDLPVIDSFNMLKEIYSISNENYKKNLDMLVELLNVKEFLNRRPRIMSLGERMKCELIASLLHDPKILFLDEPTIGLDVVSAQVIRDFIKRINKEKKCTIILTSHYMGDVEELCKRVIIINKGEKIYDGELAKLKEKYAPKRKIQIYLNSIEDKEAFAHIKSEKRIEENIGIILVDKKEIGQVVKEVFSKFNPEDISINEIETAEVISKIFLEHE